MRIISSLFAVGLICLFFFFLVRSVATGFTGVTGRRFRAYRQLARRYHGKYEPRGIGESPTVSFTYRGASVRVGLAPGVAGRPNPPRTRVVARFAKGVPLRMELMPRGRPAPKQSPKGTRVVELGDESLDNSYLIHANDPDVAKGIMRTPALRALENLRRLAPPHGMLLSVNPERMLAQVDRNLAAQPELLILTVAQALELLDAIQETLAAQLARGITIQEFGAADEADTGVPICKVCGESVTHQVREVACSLCGAPHHADCWDFNGGCSVFGCSGKRAVPARKPAG